MWVQSLGRKDPLEEGMATHSSILAWRIPWTEELLHQMCCHFSHVQLFATIWTVALHVPLSTGFSRQGYWSGLPCPPPGDLPDQGLKSLSPAAPALQVDSLPLGHRGNLAFVYLVLFDLFPPIEIVDRVITSSSSQKINRNFETREDK